MIHAGSEKRVLQYTCNVKHDADGQSEKHETICLLGFNVAFQHLRSYRDSRNKETRNKTILPTQGFLSISKEKNISGKI